MCLLKALISIGLMVVRRSVIYFPKHMLTHWLQPTEFQEDLEYFKSYLEKAKQKNLHHFSKLISIPVVILQIVIAFFLTVTLPGAFCRIPLTFSVMQRVTNECKDALVFF